MASDLIERLRAATMGFDWSDLPDDACIPAVPLLREAATALAIERERAEKAEALADRLKLEAQIHAGEARCANDTINQAYRAVTGGTGEPGNWHGAEPIKQALAETRASLAEAKRLNQSLADALRESDVWVMGALQCKDWHWDADQRDFATLSVNRAHAALKEFDRFLAQEEARPTEEPQR